jgi:hypothetical protein
LVERAASRVIEADRLERRSLGGTAMDGMTVTLALPDEVVAAIADQAAALVHVQPRRSART